LLSAPTSLIGSLDMSTINSPISASLSRT
jgi:hypothetical protein